MVRRKTKFFRCQHKSCTRHTDRKKGHDKSFCRSHQPLQAAASQHPPGDNPLVAEQHQPSQQPSSESTIGLVFSVRVKGWTKKATMQLRDEIEKIHGHHVESYLRYEAPMSTRMLGIAATIMQAVAPTMEKKTGIPLDCFLPPYEGGVLVAPAAIPTSRPWRQGKLHRDVLLSDLRSYTCIFLVSDMTSDNGAIEIYPDTCSVPGYEKEGSTTIFRRMEKAGCSQQRLLTGPAGTLFVFDSRCFHRSLPNLTDSHRWTLNWKSVKLDPYKS